MFSAIAMDSGAGGRQWLGLSGDGGHRKERREKTRWVENVGTRCTYTMYQAGSGCEWNNERAEVLARSWAEKRVISVQ
jgi:hypothetical protein